MDPCATLALVAALAAGAMAYLWRRETSRRLAAESARATLAEIVEALPGGFVAWDADDRMIMHDAEFVRVYALTAPFFRPGARFEDVVRAGALAGQFPAADGNLEAFVERTVADHRRGGQTFERRMPDGTWLLISERRMAGGGIVGVRSDITALKRAEIALAEATARAEHLARHDPLTGLPNRSVFEAALNERCDRPEPVGLLCLDLDGFKAVNDTFGHAAGDTLLKEVADRLRRVAGDVAQVARIGGDEFALILPPGTQERHGSAVADLLVRVLAEPYRIGVRNVTFVGASVGLAFESGFVADDLARAADDASYAAKRAGRRTWRRARWPVPQAA
jgi:diguanylate cyclase (GGDEF)-like protein